MALQKPKPNQQLLEKLRFYQACFLKNFSSKSLALICEAKINPIELIEKI